MGAKQKQQIDPDQAGVSNAAIAAAFGLCLMLFVGAFWQLFNPFFTSPAVQMAYRFLMVGMLFGCPAWMFLMIRLGGARDTSEHSEWYKRFRDRIINGDVSGYYSHVIIRVIARVDNFFGDTDTPPRRNWTHAVFGLKNAARSGRQLLTIAA
jgi:hypothetical protein